MFFSDSADFFKNIFHPHSHTLQSAQILSQSHSTERSDSPTVALYRALRFSHSRTLYQTRSPPDAISTRRDLHGRRPLERSRSPMDV